ncbi:DNA gyrase modulator, partial [Mesorhizobium sp.]
MTNTLDAGKLTGRVAALVEAAKRAGADAADAVAVRGRSAGVSVRLGKVEGTESSESEDVSLRVFVGQRVASVSATAASDP